MTRAPFQSLTLATLAQSVGSFWRMPQQSLGVLAQATRQWTSLRAVSQPLQILAARATEVFQIKKLRGQKFPKTMMPYSIGKSGVEVYPEEKVFI